MSRVKQLVGYPGYYVTSDGRILSSKYIMNQFGKTSKFKRRWLKQRKQNSGYAIVDIVGTTGKKYTKTIHRLVAEYFVAGDTTIDVNHIDGDKLNNLYSNLEWITKSANSKHAWDIGIQCKSKAQARGKILGAKPQTEASKVKLSSIKVSISQYKAQEIRDYYKDNSLSIVKVATLFNVSNSTVQRCIHNTFKCYNLI